MRRRAAVKRAELAKYRALLDKLTQELREIAELGPICVNLTKEGRRGKARFRYTIDDHDDRADALEFALTAPSRVYGVDLARPGSDRTVVVLFQPKDPP